MDCSKCKLNCREEYIQFKGYLFHTNCLVQDLNKRLGKEAAQKVLEGIHDPLEKECSVFSTSV